VHCSQMRSGAAKAHGMLTMCPIRRPINLHMPESSSVRPKMEEQKGLVVENALKSFEKSAQELFEKVRAVRKWPKGEQDRFWKQFNKNASDSTMFPLYALVNAAFERTNKEDAGDKERPESSLSSIKERIALAPARRTLTLVRDS
jgi:hypothetical protein